MTTLDSLFHDPLDLTRLPGRADVHAPPVQTPLRQVHNAFRADRWTPPQLTPPGPVALLDQMALRAERLWAYNLHALRTAPALPGQDSAPQDLRVRCSAVDGGAAYWIPALGARHLLHEVHYADPALGLALGEPYRPLPRNGEDADTHALRVLLNGEARRTEAGGRLGDLRDLLYMAVARCWTVATLPLMKADLGAVDVRGGPDGMTAYLSVPVVRAWVVRADHDWDRRVGTPDPTRGTVATPALSLHEALIAARGELA
ncbi:hypothetical protein [Deinococcus kurensis]|uniref:hypothetical protein n=1 Tax=Deinococcus kurensis TaxID=2662757 RepID=UPI0012D2E993|nr:hypothetical protein [Deinococcus kurensis]